ncbi:MAG: hydroxymethylbilane synthase [Alphaproteobacteria bacterium]|nr:hydroxymethylbilane synthase [Alphaproteobacteria bacterium]
MAPSVLRIGTRGSPLALAQADELRRRLAAEAALAAPGAVEIVAIRTSGDRTGERPLASAGGKGLFTKEIEEALLAGRIDLAIHSMKDMTATLPKGLAIAACLPREDPRDALLSLRAKSLAALPQGARLGTSSLRRKALALVARPDFAIVPLRGNVGTRLAKLEAGNADATVLAVAGLKRLGLAGHIAAILSPDEMLPAPAQGVLAVEIREDDMRVRRLLAPLDHAETATCAAAERAFLAALDGSCRTPIAALATLAGGRLALDAAIARPDGGALHRTHRDGLAGDAAALGRDAGAELKTRGGPGFFA